MAYSSWSVVFGEQPSAAKWNILGTNDAHFDNLIGESSGGYVELNSLLYSNNEALVEKDNVLIQTGWAYIRFDGGSSEATEAISYPVAVTTPLGVVLTMNGVKNGSNPSDVSDLDNTNLNIYAQTRNIGTSTFVAQLRNDQGDDPAASGRYVFSWIAWGQE